MKYVNTKFMKRMAACRVRNPAENGSTSLLLPLSFGVSSVTLLYLLDKRLHEKTNRSPKDSSFIHVVFVDMSAIEPGSPSLKYVESVKERFPRHIYWVMRIEEIFDYDNRVCEALQIDSASASPWRWQDNSKSNREKLESYISSLSSATAKSDVLEMLKIRLIVQLAKRHNHPAVLWGDTATKMAEKTLAETAKGRGCFISPQISEGALAYGVLFYYPLRDLLRTELVAHSALITPPLEHLTVSRPSLEGLSAPARKTTLDELITQYFTGVEQTYPNIIANVVNTSGKLKTQESQLGGSSCLLCGMQTEQCLQKLEDLGTNLAKPVTKSVESEDHGKISKDLCHSCERTLLPEP